MVNEDIPQEYVMFSRWDRRRTDLIRQFCNANHTFDHSLHDPDRRERKVILTCFNTINTRCSDENLFVTHTVKWKSGMGCQIFDNSGLLSNKHQNGTIQNLLCAYL